MNYQVYLFSCLLKKYDKEFEEMEYDLQFEEAPFRYADFEKSSFNVSEKGEYDCMVEYLENKYIIMENNFKINEFVSIIRKDNKNFVINPIIGDEIETRNEIKGIIKINKPLFKNGNYIDRQIAIQIIGEIGLIHLVNSQIKRK